MSNFVPINNEQQKVDSSTEVLPQMTKVKRCIYCHSEIPFYATICSECGQPQPKIKKESDDGVLPNLLGYILIFAGILMFMGFIYGDLNFMLAFLSFVAVIVGAVMLVKK